MKQRKLIDLACLVVLMFNMAAFAGSLEPSALPAPTMKTLDQVEPRIPIPASSTPAIAFNISQSGSYYLTGDRNTSSKGIYVDANNVTIDLMGYSLIGSGNGSAGIQINGKKNVQVRNGTIRNFGYQGIAEYNGNVGAGHSVINVRAIDNGVLGTAYVGILLPGQGHLIKDCVSTGNGIGISVGSGCTVIGNVVFKNDDWGIFTLSGCTVVGNTVYSNVGKGIQLGAYCLLDQNTSYNNTGGNLLTGAGCTLGTNCAP